MYRRFFVLESTVSKSVTEINSPIHFIFYLIHCVPYPNLTNLLISIDYRTKFKNLNLNIVILYKLSLGIELLLQVCYVWLTSTYRRNLSAIIGLQCICLLCIYML